MQSMITVEFGRGFAVAGRSTRKRSAMSWQRDRRNDSRRPQASPTWLTWANPL